MKRTWFTAGLYIALCFSLPACGGSAGETEVAPEGQHKIVATSPDVKDVVFTQEYVSQIHSRRHITVQALEDGYLEEIPVKEGQTVKEGDVLFKVVPALYRARLNSALAEAKLAEIEFNNSKKLFEQKIVSAQDLALQEAKLSKAKAQADLAGSELNFTTVKAPFAGIVDRLRQQQGSLVKEGDTLTTLSDNLVTWVYFNVPEADYLDYMADRGKDGQEKKIGLVLANGSTFPYPGAIAAIEAQFNNETGTIPFRADFPNPDGLLRHGQTGTVQIRRTARDAIVIPQRATFQILARRYVFVVDSHNVVRQRGITVAHELDDVFILKDGLAADERIILEGVRQVHDGDTVKYEYRTPAEVLADQKYHAE